MESAPETGLPCGRLSAFSQTLAAQETIAGVLALVPDLHRLQRDLAIAGFSGALACRLISSLNDALTESVIHLVAARHRLPPAAWCWLAMGSEGRGEQTLVTDQDNGLVFVACNALEADAMRERFLPFASEVNQRLADCGFPLCPGNIMAGNPDWCLSLQEWEMRFVDWVRCPHPEALLNASIFFDLRPLTGDLSLGRSLRKLLLQLTSDTPAFLHLMAANALHAVPPLGFLGDVAVDEAKGVDLKKSGSRIFVDVARILSLAAGTPAVNSFERLSEAGRASGMPQLEVAGAQAALSNILRLRLAHQAIQSPGDKAAVFCPDDLHDLDRVVLKESLHLAKRLQQRLKLNYLL